MKCGGLLLLQVMPEARDQSIELAAMAMEGKILQVSSEGPPMAVEGEGV